MITPCSLQSTIIWSMHFKPRNKKIEEILDLKETGFKR